MSLLLGSAALATAVDIAGKAVGVLAETAGFKQWAGDCLERALAGHTLPGNHDLVRGARSAHLCAVKAVVLAHRALLAKLPPGEISDDERAFAGLVQDFVDQRLKIAHSDAIDHSRVTVDDLAHLLRHAIDPADNPSFRQAATAARHTASQRALAELEGHCKWPAPPLFRAMFSGYAGLGWHAIYSLYLSEALKTNERFRAIFFAAELVDLRRLTEQIDARSAKLLELHPALAEFRAETHTHLVRIEAALAEISAALRVRGMAPLFNPRIDGPGTGVGSHYIFRFARDAWRGRHNDFAVVERVLFAAEVDSHPARQWFRWHAVVGAAGAGKSRFALEFLERHRHDWPINGFVHAGAVDERHAQDWPLQQPSLLVVDYAAAKPRLVDFVAAFAERANRGQLAHPLRLLLIERRRHERVFDELLSEAPVAGLQMAKVCGPQAPHTLSRLARSEVLQLMRARLGNHPASAFTDDDLLQQLTEFDPEQRPLFAAIVADAMAQGHLATIGRDASGEDRRWQLFGDLLQRERLGLVTRLVAEGLPAARAKAITARHVNFAALATMVRGIDPDKMNRLYDSGLWRVGEQLHVPEPPEFDTEDALRADLHEALAGVGEQDAVQMLAAVEPDLIGERLVLEVLTSAHARSDLAHWLRVAAWTLEPYAAAAFARLCAQDYWRHSADLGFLMAGTDTPALRARSALLRAIAADLSLQVQSEHRPRVDVLRQLSQVGAAIEMLDEASAGDVTIARNLAALLQQVVNVAARALSTRIDPVGVGLDPVLGHAANSQRLGRQFGVAGDVATAAQAEGEAAQLALRLLPALIQGVHGLRARLSDPQALESLSCAMGDGVRSVYWARRHQAAAGGLAQVRMSAADTRAAAALLEDAFTLLQSPQAGAADMAYAMRLIADLQFAQYEDTTNAVLDARIADTLLRMDSHLLRDRRAVDAVLPLCANTMLGIAASADVDGAGRRIRLLTSLLRSLPFDWDTAARSARRSWLLGHLNGADLLRRSSRDVVDSQELWRHALARPEFAPGLEDGLQQERIDGTVGLILGWQQVAPERTAALWTRAAQWVGNTAWDSWSRRSAQWPLWFWALRHEAHADQAVLSDFLQRLGQVFVGPPERGSLPVPALVAQGLVQVLPSETPLPDAAAAALGSVVLQALHPAGTGAAAVVVSQHADRAQAQRELLATGWVHLVVQRALDGHLPHALALGDALALQLAAVPALATPLCLAIASLALLPEMNTAGRRHMGRWLALTRADMAAQPSVWRLAERALTRTAAAGVDQLAATRDTPLEAIDQRLIAMRYRQLKALDGAPSAQQAAWLVQLGRLLLRSPDAAGTAGFREVLANLPADHPQAQGLHHMLAALEAHQLAMVAARGRQQRIDQELADTLRAPRAQDAHTASLVRAAWQPAPPVQAWPFEPPFTAAWHAVTAADEATDWLDRLGACLGGEQLFSDLLLHGISGLRWAPLSFYGGGVVLELALANTADATRLVLLTEAGAMYLEGTSPRVHACNAVPGLLRLGSAGQAADYLRFFCGVVQGDHGPFTVTEQTQVLLARTAPGQAAPTLDELPHLSPLTLEAFTAAAGADQGLRADGWTASTFVHYGPAVFRARFTIALDGKVTMPEDEPLWHVPGCLRQPVLRRDGVRTWARAD